MKNNCNICNKKAFYRCLDCGENLCSQHIIHEILSYNANCSMVISRCKKCFYYWKMKNPIKLEKKKEEEIYEKYYENNNENKENNKILLSISSLLFIITFISITIVDFFMNIL